MAEDTILHKGSSAVFHRDLHADLGFPANRTQNIGTENGDDDLGVRFGILSLVLLLCALIIITRIYYGRYMPNADDRTLPDEDMSDEEKDMADSDESAVFEGSPAHQTSDNPTIPEPVVNEQGDP